MANKGNIGKDIRNITLASTQGFPGMQGMKIMTHDANQQFYNAHLTQNSTDGFPSAPCMQMNGPHSFFFEWPVVAGSRTISINVKYSPDNGSGTRPKLIIKANKGIGINSDIITFAPSGANSWNTLGPVSVTPTATGVLLCELRLDAYLPTIQTTLWDNVVVT